MAPPIPERPRPAEHKTASRMRNLLTIGFTFTAIGLIMAFVSVFSVGFTIVFGLFAGCIAFHYFVWGWWLSRLIHDEEADH